ncbi:hypothetical protein [Micromonospora sp. WMMD710]|uniref:hypothetical protein n=1 Tax=Micromonospora sp. WMMD710 TaxID=3016085 RepID=UPI002417F91D|nr:hypothetical protein [Micromonospora sp. WMMD710]MDG4761260.1 hypothetical protein [Micromonospora sp. WMMD710]
MPFTPRRRASTPSRAVTHTVLPATLALLTIGAVTGCGTPPELRNPGAAPTGTGSPTAAPTRTPGTTPTTAPSLPPFGTPSATPDAGLVATACRNGPTGQRVVQLLRGQADVLPPNVRVQVRTGPLCAADWQYTVLDVTGHEELQVVTRGRPTAPELVTAGTDVCTIEVRATGPTGIRTLACDAGPAIGPGA